MHVHVHVCRLNLLLQALLQVKHHANIHVYMTAHKPYCKLNTLTYMSMTAQLTLTSLCCRLNTVTYTYMYVTAYCKLNTILFML